MGTNLVNRELVACGACGWVHYLMAAAEKASHDNALTRYTFSPRERETLELEHRQCLRCESPSQIFRRATDKDISAALNHIVTPIILEGTLVDA
jgi:hypothetical protein